MKCKPYNDNEEMDISGSYCLQLRDIKNIEANAFSKPQGKKRH